MKILIIIIAFILISGCAERDVGVLILQWNSPSDCENLSDAYMKDDCLCKTNEGTKTCYQTGDQSMKNQCYIQIAIDHDNISICDCDRFVSQNCRYQYIISKGNPELCITLEDGTSIVASCIREFAVINNDSAICKITPNQKDVEYCYRDVAIRACNIEVCEGINDSVKKYACVNDIQIFCREIN